MSFPQQLKVDTEIPQQHASHPSAIIAVPSSWGSTESLQTQQLETSATVSPKDCSIPTLPKSIDLGALPQSEHPLPGGPRDRAPLHGQLSATVSSSSSKSSYPWAATSKADEMQRDPFDATGSFSEDPYAPSSSSSSGDDWDARFSATGAQVAIPVQTPTEWHPPGRPTNNFTGINRSFTSSRTVGSLLQPHADGSGQYDARHSLSRELVDSLQTAIQTLLYVSPPHLLDNAKEQYSGCAIQMPTTSVSALFTSIRGLNYLSANLVSLCEGKAQCAGQLEDFDIGELLQNVADQLGGDMALSEVDLVLFHGDIGMKHVNMNGDRAGIAYILGHVLRQILAVANKGDTIEMGLQIVPQSLAANNRRVSLPIGPNEVDPYRRRASSQISLEGQEGPFMCVFEIVHNVAQHMDSNAATPKAELNPFTRLAEQKEAATPKLDTPLCHQLLRHVNAWLKTDAVPSSPSSFGLSRHAYELGMVLGRGAPIVEPTPLSPEEEATRQPFSGLRLPMEPTLTELSEFAETLRGKRVNLHASLSSVFARHLTSYLAAWGLDVSHVPIEDDIQAAQQPPVDAQPARFVIIDDDVTVLRRELLKLRADTCPPTVQRQRSFKRPGLFRSTRSAMALRQNVGTVIIHFTSLDKYHQVRDVVASMGVLVPPEIMVVPKPVGPRRFLTALFTAIKQPAVDPAFSPIATSPRSPHISSGSHTPTSTFQEGFFDGIELPPTAEAGITKVRSPLAEHPPSLASASRPSHENLRLPSSTSEDLVTTPASEYFSRATTARQTSTGASGVVIQSPDGRPFGMFFEPPPSATSGVTRADSSRRATTIRQASIESDHATMSESPDSSRRPSAVSGVSETTDESNNAPESAASDATSPPVSIQQPPSKRKTLPTAPDAKPVVAQGRGRSSTATRRHTQGNDEDNLLNLERRVAPRNTKESDAVIPPINVLIVEDNPINQNILSMFFKRKKIKHQTAKDGQEAVEKWQTGGFHLILMDIQLPVMDGIEATKEIRKLEKRNNVGVFPSTPTGEFERPMEAVPPSSPFRSSVIIVALTASSLQTDRVAALAAGCNDFLTKPVSLKWLERKTVEWGCMQALIDFDGWRR